MTSITKQKLESYKSIVPSRTMHTGRILSHERPLTVPNRHLANTVEHGLILLFGLFHAFVLFIAHEHYFSVTTYNLTMNVF